LTNNARNCLKSWSNTVNATETVSSFHKTTKRTPRLEYGSPSNVRRRRRQEFDPDRIGRSRLENQLVLFGMLIDHRWEDMFAKLEEYHHKHADCLVLQCTLQRVSLTWEMGQHGAQRYQRDKLGSERISTRLESIGFVWWVLDRHALS
jgi:hypothetical protein